MAENRVTIEGMYTGGEAYSGGSINPLPVILTSNPQIDGVYILSIANVPGTVASNTFMTLFNPVGSGKVFIVGGMFVSTVAAAATSATQPTRLHRIDAAPTGGTLVTNSTDIFKFDTNAPTAVGVLRTGNPTATLGVPASNTPPPVTTGAGGGQFVHIVEPPPGTTVILRPGEGVAVNNSAGDTSQRWNISLAWAEV